MVSIYKLNKPVIRNKLASFDYDCITEQLDNYTHKSIFNPEDFSIIIFKHEIGVDYILTYKNFDTRSDAYNYCTKYLDFLKNCLIINVENLD